MCFPPTLPSLTIKRGFCQIRSDSKIRSISLLSIFSLFRVIGALVFMRSQDQAETINFEIIFDLSLAIVGSSLSIVLWILVSCNSRMSKFLLKFSAHILLLCQTISYPYHGLDKNCQLLTQYFFL